FASLTLAVGLAALLGYVLHLPPAYDWGWVTRMAALTALAFAVLGLSLLAQLVYRSQGPSSAELPWMATSIGIAASLLTVIFWHAL
ncbi:hypothetical protein ABTM28_20785, partial [Acinetobacter baumannii]